MNPRVRIAPSPTGFLHLGTARAALFNYLFAKKNNGAFIVRIEDTDLERSNPAFTKDILDGMRWLGLAWDEGPEGGGEYGPYEQSKRTDSYRKPIQKLITSGHLYECFCTPDELESERIEAAKHKQAPKYSGHCRNLSEPERQKFREQGRMSILRFRTPEKTVRFRDMVRGELSFDTSLIGDFSVARNVETPLYNLAVVIDDETMNITHVIRGEDHISNTPKQLLLIEALRYRVPEYAHLPLILNSDRSKMSKRKNKVSLIEYRNEGYLPEALVNFMALLGWNPKSEQEIFSLDELVQKFDLASVNKAGAVLNLEKLNWMNGEYVKTKSLDELIEIAAPFLPKDLPKERARKVVEVQRPRVNVLKEFSSEAEYFVSVEDFPAERLLWKTMTPEQGRAALAAAKDVCEKAEQEYESPHAMEAYLKDVIQKRGLKPGEFLWPLRVALSGRERSHSPFEIAYVIGKNETVKRIDRALASLK